MAKKGVCSLERFPAALNAFFIHSLNAMLLLELLEHFLTAQVWLISAL